MGEAVDKIQAEEGRGRLNFMYIYRETRHYDICTVHVFRRIYWVRVRAEGKEIGARVKEQCKGLLATFYGMDSIHWILQLNSPPKSTSTTRIFCCAFCNRYGFCRGWKREEQGRVSRVVMQGRPRLGRQGQGMWCSEGQEGQSAGGTPAGHSNPPSSPPPAFSSPPAPSSSRVCIMREIVHLQAGQCGNQIGAKVRTFFKHFSNFANSTNII